MVDVEKVDAKVMRVEAKRLGLDPAGDKAVLAHRLAAWVEKNVSLEDTADCDTCGGDSDVSWERCPYCGDGALAEVNGGKVVVKKAADLVPKAAVAKVVVAKVVATETDLDVRVQRIGQLKATAAVNIHALGVEISVIHDRELWTQRKGKDGSARYPVFRTFCVVELGMSHTYAYKLMALAKAFSSEEVAKLGQGKLGIVMQVSGEAREKLLSMAKAGAPMALLGEERKAINKRGRRRAKIKQKHDSVIESARTDLSLTVVTAPGRLVIPLYRRVAAPDGTHRPAERVVDDPWGEEITDNLIRTRYVVKLNERGELVLVIDRVRVKV